MGRFGFLVGSILAAVTTTVGGPSLAAPSPETVAAVLRSATSYLTSIAIEGGYIWRYSPDLETAPDATRISVQSPGTPRIGEAFLAAWAATNDRRHLAAAAAAATALLRGQLMSGGWDFRVELDPDKRDGLGYLVDKNSRMRSSTYGDDTTQGALRFLMAFVDAARGHWRDDQVREVDEALRFGLDRMLESQYPNGAWPQRFVDRLKEAGTGERMPAQVPDDWERTWLDADIATYYTLNDEAIPNCIRTMIAAWKRSGDQRYLDAAREGGAFLIAAQLPEPQAGWAQQYNFDMEPAWGRPYEPPAVASRESAEVVRVLVELYLETGEDRFLEPIPAFIDWIEDSPIAPNTWARFYELRTNRPIYADGSIRYALDEIADDHAREYGWQSNFDIASTIALYEAVMEEGREDFMNGRRPDRRQPDAHDIEAILAGQDGEGRWLTDGWIDIETFADNIETLAAYLHPE